MLLTMTLALAAASNAQENLATYTRCTSDHAISFKAGDLSGDSDATVIEAAKLSCNAERSAFVDAVDSFTRERHPDLGAGSRAKVTAMFVKMREDEMKVDLMLELSAKGATN